MKKEEYSKRDLEPIIRNAMLWIDYRLRIDFLQTLNELNAQKNSMSPKEEADYKVAMMLDLDKLEQEAVSLARIARAVQYLDDLVDSLFETTALIRTKLAVAVADLIRKPGGIDGKKLFENLEKKGNTPGLKRVRSLVMGLVEG